MNGDWPDHPGFAAGDCPHRHTVTNRGPWGVIGGGYGCGLSGGHCLPNSQCQAEERTMKHDIVDSALLGCPRAKINSITVDAEIDETSPIDVRFEKASPALSNMPPLSRMDGIDEMRRRLNGYRPYIGRKMRDTATGTIHRINEVHFDEASMTVNFLFTTLVDTDVTFARNAEEIISGECGYKLEEG